MTKRKRKMTEEKNTQTTAETPANEDLNDTVATTNAETVEDILSGAAAAADGQQKSSAGKVWNDIAPEAENMEEILPEVPAEEEKTAAPKAKADQAAAEQIEILTRKLAEAERLRLLALAEMDNQRKRAAKERDNLRAHVEQDTLMPFLQVFEHFSMAVKAVHGATNVDAIVKGLEMIQTEFDKAFSELGVEKIDALGKEFNPEFHEAVAQEPSETVPAGIVLKQWSFGFKSGDRLIKPAMVIVSSGTGE